MVYLRRSSNRDDRQEESLSDQEIWARKEIGSNVDLRVVGIDGRVYSQDPSLAFIKESHTAKQDGPPRPLFNKMLEVIRTQGIDWLIVWEPSRISRNNEDMTEFLRLLRGKDRKIQKGVISEIATFFTDREADIEHLQRHLEDARRMNQIHSHVSKRTQEIRKTSKNLFTHLFPFGYGHVGKSAEVYLIDKEVEYYKMAVQMRFAGCSWTEISDKFRAAGFNKDGGAIKKLLENRRYCGEFEFEGEIYPVKNKGFIPLIDKEDYLRLLEYNKKNRRTYKKANPLHGEKTLRLLDYMVFDVTGRPLQGYIKKGITYYRQPTKRPTYEVNLPESKLFAEAEKQIHRFQPTPQFAALVGIELESRLRTVLKERKKRISQLEKEILEETDSIATMAKELHALDPNTRKIVLDTIKSSGVAKTAKEQELEQLRASTLETEATASRYADYFRDLPGTYRRVSKKEKADILRGLGIYFVVGPDKYIAAMGGDFEKLFISRS